MSDVDVLIIGSGAGGLAAAVALARAGEKVLVLEQHYLPGGWCHSFHLGGYRFSPGVHYIGELQQGGRMRRLYEGLGVGGDLDFFELHPQGYDHVLLGDERFDIPKGREAFAARLAERFPSEKRGIREYLAAVQRISDQLDAMTGMDRPIDALLMPFRSPTVARWAFRSARAMMRNYVRDPKLEAILGAQAGDHGLPPSLAPAPLHAAVAAHYFEGGWYPRGGGGAIPRAFIRALRRAGGDIRVRTPVSKILLEKGRAIGVRLKDGTEIRARRAVISNADPHVTFHRLVGRENISPALRKRLDATKYSVSALSLFMAARIDPSELGLDSGNYWLYPDGDVDRTYRTGMTNWIGRGEKMPGMFLTLTSLKDPTKKLPRGVHTMEAFTFVSYDDFEKWARTTYGERPEDYVALKRDLQERMLRALEAIVPDLRNRLEFVELGTPLTNVHYVEATRGNLYGTEKSMRNLGPFAYPLRTEIDGLLLCGASTMSHGVMGATMSGLFAAAKVLRCDARSLLARDGAPVGIHRTDDRARWPAAWANAASKGEIDLQEEAALAP